MRKPTLLVLLTNCNRRIYQERIMDFVLHNDKNRVNVQFYRYEKEEKYDRDIQKLIEYDHIKHIFIMEGEYSESLWNYFVKAGLKLYTFMDSITNATSEVIKTFHVIDPNYEYQLIDFIKGKKQKVKRREKVESSKPKLLLVTDHQASIEYQKKCYQTIMEQFKKQYGSSFEIYLLDSRNDNWLSDSEYKIKRFNHSIDTIFVYHDYYGKIRNLISYSKVIEEFGKNGLAIYITDQFMPYSYFNHLFVFLKESNDSFEIMEEKNQSDCSFQSYFEKINHAKKLEQFYHLPIDKNKIFFVSYDGNQYSCNPKYICEYILEHHLPYQLVWGFQNLDNENVKYLEKHQVKCVEINSLEYYQELIRSKYWISNCRMDFGVRKRKDQVYIQTWHGGLAIKNIEKVVQQTLSPEYLKIALRDCFLTDFVTVSGKWDFEHKQASFWYPHRYLMSGLPRNDILFSQNKMLEIKEKLQIPSNTKVVLYAPTFRQNYLFDYKIDSEKVIKTLAKRFGGDWIFAVKFHPNLLNDPTFIEQYKNQNPNVIDFSSCDIQEILTISDLLISDYSSTVFDYMLLKKPIVLYIPDYEKYKESERTLLQDVKSLPFLLCKDEKEFHHVIEHYDEKEYISGIEKFQSEVGIVETGNACEMVIKEMSKY